MAVGQLPQARDGFVDGTVDVEVLTLQIFPALPAVVEPDEENPDVVGRSFADQEGITRQAAALVNQGRGVRPVGIVEHGLVQRPQDALECVLFAHIPENTRVMRLKSSRKRRLAFPGPVGKCRFPFPSSPRPAISIPFRLSSISLLEVASSVHSTLSPVPSVSPHTAVCCARTFLAPIARTAARHRTAIAIRAHRVPRRNTGVKKAGFSTNLP